LSAFPPTHHEPLPTMPVSIQRNHRSRFGSTRVLQHNRGMSGHRATLRTSGDWPTADMKPTSALWMTHPVAFPVIV